MNGSAPFIASYGSGYVFSIKGVKEFPKLIEEKIGLK